MKKSIKNHAQKLLNKIGNKPTLKKCKRHYSKDFRAR